MPQQSMFMELNFCLWIHITTLTLRNPRRSHVPHDEVAVDDNEATGLIPPKSTPERCTSARNQGDPSLPALAASWRALGKHLQRLPVWGDLF